MPPDLICTVSEEGCDITNSELKVGLKVHIIGVKALDVWRTPEGIDILDPKYVGFNLDYELTEHLIS